MKIVKFLKMMDSSVAANADSNSSGEEDVDSIFQDCPIYQRVSENFSKKSGQSGLSNYEDECRRVDEKLKLMENKIQAQRKEMAKTYAWSKEIKGNWETFGGTTELNELKNSNCKKEVRIEGLNKKVHELENRKKMLDEEIRRKIPQMKYLAIAISDRVPILKDCENLFSVAHRVVQGIADGFNATALRTTNYFHEVD